MMIEWKDFSIPEIIDKWNSFISARNFKMEQDHPDFISMDDREWLIIELLTRFQGYISKPVKKRR